MTARSRRWRAICRMFQLHRSGRNIGWFCAWDGRTFPCDNGNRGCGGAFCRGVKREA